MVAPVTGAVGVVLCANPGSVKAAKAALIKLILIACFMGYFLLVVRFFKCVWSNAAASTAQEDETQSVNKCCEVYVVQDERHSTGRRAEPVNTRAKRK